MVQINHGSDALAFITAMPPERVRYLHVAGHQQISPDLLIDTHGAAINDPVWELLRATYQHIGVRPTLLERDFNIPTWQQLQSELQQIQQLQQEAGDV